MPKTAVKDRPAKSVKSNRRAPSAKNEPKRRLSPSPANASPRRLQAPKAIWYRPLSWRHRPLAPVRRPLPKARIMLWKTLQQFWQHKVTFGGIALIYGLLNLLLVRSVSGSNNLSTLKTVLEGLGHGVMSKVAASAGSFAYLLSTSGSGNTAGSGVYQGTLLLTCSLAFIWVLRQTLAGHTVRIRDGFYLGMYPLVPFLLIFLLMVVQLVPMVIGGGIYGTIVVNGIAAHFWERALWLGLFIVLGVWSLRMVTATIFALYIVTLPNMTPMKAYKNARQLVYARRLLVWRKLVFLLTVVLILALLVEVPLISFAIAVAPWALFVLSMAILPLVHGYLYNLYREML